MLNRIAFERCAEGKVREAVSVSIEEGAAITGVSARRAPPAQSEMGEAG